MEVLNQEDGLEVAAKGFVDINHIFFASLQWHLEVCLETIWPCT